MVILISENQCGNAVVASCLKMYKYSRFIDIYRYLVWGFCCKMSYSCLT